METLRKGSKGDDVKILQKALGLKVDGYFGPKTESAVIEFQKSKGLLADGIVGKKTWETLGITGKTSDKSVDPSVVYSPLNVHVSSLPNRTIKYIVVHYTAGSSSRKGSALRVKNVFETRKASADFCVDNKTMVQFNPDIKNKYCWSVGDKKYKNTKGASLHGIATNRNTINIEMCSTLKEGFSANYANHEGWYFTDDTLKQCAQLVKILMRKFNIPIERVVRHYDVTGKLCPGVIGWNDEIIYTNEGKSTKNRSNSSKWTEFLELLKE